MSNPGVPSDADQTHPHSAANPDTKASESKARTTFSMVTDPKFPLPLITSSTPVLRYIQSFTVLSVIIGAGLVFTYSIDAEILRIADPKVMFPCAFAAVMATLLFTGTAWIDWWELVLGYWWISMPLGAAAGLVLVLKQETDAALHEMA